MASRHGATVQGTDGNDYSNRETIVKHYHVSAEKKSELKSRIFGHIILWLIMAMKLFPAILDKLDIYIPEIKEIPISEPEIWEWIWGANILTTAVAWNACTKSKAFNMKIFQVLTILTGVIPIILGMNYHFRDAYAFVTGGWRNGLTVDVVPVLWYKFFLDALYVHGTEFFLAHTLVNAWKPKKNN